MDIYDLSSLFLCPKYREIDYRLGLPEGSCVGVILNLFVLNRHQYGEEFDKEYLEKILGKDLLACLIVLDVLSPSENKYYFNTPDNFKPFYLTGGEE